MRAFRPRDLRDFIISPSEFFYQITFLFIRSYSIKAKGMPIPDVQAITHKGLNDKTIETEGEKRKKNNLDT